jgi:hypothetical protein
MMSRRFECRSFNHLLLLGAWMVLACAANGVRAADIYVSQNGSDATGDGSTGKPVGSLGKALSLAVGESTIHLPDGRFAAKGLSIPAGDGRLTIVGIPGDTWVRGPIGVTGRKIALHNLILHTDVMEKLEPPTAMEEAAPGVLLNLSGDSDVELSGCLFYGGIISTAVHLEHCQNWRIENCIFSDIYPCLLVDSSPNGRIVNNTIADTRLGHGTNSLTTGRVQLHGKETDHLVIFNNAFCPRDPDGKLLLIDGCGDDIRSDYNLCRGVFTHQYGDEQAGTWQNNFRTVGAWQAYTKQHWHDAADAHSRNELIEFQNNSTGIPRIVSNVANEFPGAGEGVSNFAGVDAPTTDFFGHSRGKIDIGAIAFDQSLPAGAIRQREFSINLPQSGRMTVAIFDADGKQVRTLVSSRLLAAGKHTLRWDGRDNSNVVDLRAFRPDAKFSFRAVVTPESDGLFDIAGAGCRWAPNSTGTDLNNQPQENGEGMWCDSKGNLYRAATYDEAGTTILSVDHDGHFRWRNWQHNGTLVTGDDQFIYIVGCDKHGKNEVALERFPLEGSGPRAWPTVRDDMSLGTTDQITPTGLATSGGKLYLSDGPHNRVLVFTIGSNKIEREITVPRPAGLIVRSDGVLAVCSRKSAGDPGGISIVSGDGATTNLIHDGFDDPVDIAATTDGAVYIADGGNGAAQQVLHCQLTPSFSIIDRIGQAGGYDANDDPVVNPNRFLQINHIAAFGSSLWVGQREPGYARNRLVRYDLDTGKSPKLGLEILSLEGQHGSAADPRDPSQVYSADLFRYDVNLNDGQWTWARNFQSARAATIGEHDACSTASVFYIGDQRFIAITLRCGTTTASRTVVIYRFDGEKLIPCAAVGGQFFGVDFAAKEFDPSKSGKWVWLDTNGDGRMQDDEIKRVEGGNAEGKPFADCTWGTFIERDGTIVWPGDAVHYLRPHGLDSSGKIPVYDWTNAVTVKYRDFVGRDEKYETRVDTDGSIFDLSTTKSEPMPQGYWGMGTVLSGLDTSGQRRFSVPLNLAAKGLAIDDNYVFVCSCFGPFINQYTKDGLLVRTFSWGKTGSQFGWFDFPTPINSVTDPKTGDSILTTEEQWFGRVMVFRVPHNVTRISGDLPAP